MLKRATDEANREIEDFKKKRTTEFEEYKREVSPNLTALFLPFLGRNLLLPSIRKWLVLKN